MTPENEKKVAYLSQYRKSKALERHCRRELAEYLLDTMVPSSKQMDGMPHGNGSNADLSDNMANIDRYENILQEQVRESERLQADIARAISKLEDRDERTVLLGLYTDKYKPSWAMLSREINVSIRTAQRIYGRALLNFRIPEDLSEEDKKFLDF